MSLSAWLKGFFNVKKTTPTCNVSPSKTVGEQQSIPLSEWGNSDIIKGLRFAATMQIRTPLRVLKHHEEIFNGSGPPPSYAKEMWEGIWVPVIKTFKELGIPTEEYPPSKMSSDVGYIPSTGGNYLNFILAVRNIIEQNHPITTRRNELFVELSKDDWKEYVNKLGGIETITNCFFPYLIELLPGLTEETIAVLRGKELITAAKILASSDKELLKIKGIGPAKLKKIRVFCSSVVAQHNEFIDKVIR
ncbi:MAG: helix-hairpin-helix domain-containing protein [Desulfobulbaceae bacterium]|jgi:hypothetical protein|nr:helix-hairpin-helix domain-containing protein [Desulfobulbaceae bacterium]